MPEVPGLLALGAIFRLVLGPESCPWGHLGAGVCEGRTRVWWTPAFL